MQSVTNACVKESLFIQHRGSADLLMDLQNNLLRRRLTGK